MDSIPDGYVFSIGHGSHSPGALLEQLNTVGVRFVVDVRSSPYSRYQPDFSREPLARFLLSHGIRYVFMGDLLGGRPKDDDCYTDGKVDYAKVRRKEFFVRGVSRLKRAHSKGLSVCLLCSEGLPSRCHRTKLVGEALSEEGISVVHLLPDGTRQSQKQVIAQLTGGQRSLFGDHFLSRKAYR